MGAGKELAIVCIIMCHACLLPVWDVHIGDHPIAFFQESLIWWNLSHPHIFSLLGIDHNLFPGIPCMVMPWMVQGNSRNVIDVMVHQTASSTLSLLTVSSLGMFSSISTCEKLLIVLKLKEISLGIAYLHREEVIHGDLRRVCWLWSEGKWWLISLRSTS